MKLVLKDRAFEIGEATLGAYVVDPHWAAKYDPRGYAGLAWALNVEAREKTFDDDETWEPSLYHESLRLPVRRWMDVAGQVVRWESPHDPVTGEANGALYLFEHGSISRAALRFTARDGLRFRFEWEGLCDVFWDDEYGQDVPFTAEGWATFTGVTVRGSARDTDESMRARLAKYLDVGDFAQGGIQRLAYAYEDGVGMADAGFRPLER